MAKAKGDHSTRVGGRRNAGSMAQKSSKNKGARGKRVSLPGGLNAYRNTNMAGPDRPHKIKG